MARARATMFRSRMCQATYLIEDQANRGARLDADLKHGQVLRLLHQHLQVQVRQASNLSPLRIKFFLVFDLPFLNRTWFNVYAE
jgi:hypothetical protein